MPQPQVLFADDDPDTREVVKKFLQLAGFRVALAGSAFDVLNRLRTDRFDALILDNWMPHTTGIELCQKIRLVDKSTPIFFCSGAVSTADIQAAKEAGAQGYFTKPVDPDELVKALYASIT